MTDLSGKRYGEVLLVTPGEAGPQANVYNSFPLNDCPAELWSALDPQAIATENGAAAALLNGPRYWLMNSIEKEQQGPQIRKTFGGIEMILQATVLLSSMNPAPYSVNKVTRHTVFVFNAGEEVYELQDPHGHRWVMQTWSQVVDPNLTRADLPEAGRPAQPPRRMVLPDAGAHRRAARGHHVARRPGHPGRPDQQLFAGDRLTLTGTDPGWTRCRWPATRSTTCR